MYQQLGYIVYRTVLEYYNGDPDEDAYGELVSMEFAYIFDHNNMLLFYFQI